MLIYFQANSGLYHPDLDPDQTVAAERVAAYRLFVCGPQMVWTSRSHSSLAGD